MFSAIIVTTGKTARKDHFEPWKEVGSISAIQRIIMVFQRAGIQRIAVICDTDKTRLTSYANVVYLYGDKHADMLSNLKIGLTYLQDKCTAAIITHVDVPLFSVETVRTLMAADAPLCIPQYGGCTGHPILLQVPYFHTVLSYTGAEGLAGAMKASHLKAQLIAVEDEGILTNIQRQENYTHLLSSHNLTQLHPDIQIRLTKEKPFYDPEVQQLLQLTEETASLRNACTHMGISYSKARAMVSQAEQQIGYPILERQQGGKSGGYSMVTTEGKQFMQNYTSFCREATSMINDLFLKYFKEETETLVQDAPDQ